jgi:hypothetical protein
MVNPFPIPRQLRQTDVFVGDGGATYSGFSFKIFDIVDVQVWIKAEDETAFSQQTVTVAKLNNLPFDDFSVTFLSGQPNTTDIVVRSARVAERTAGVDNGTRIGMDALEKELSKQATVLQEVRRDVDRAVMADFGQAGMTIDVDIPDGASLKKEGNRLVQGPDVGAGDAALAAAIATEAAIRGAADSLEAATRAAADAAEIVIRSAADTALASLIGQAGPIETAVFDSRLAISMANVKPTIGTIIAGGYSLPGDGGVGRYARVVAQPSHPGKVQSLDGAWWELRDRDAYPEQFGAKADGVTVDFAAFTDARSYVVAKGGTLKLTAAKTYNSGTTFLYLGDIVIDPEPGAAIVGNFNPNDTVVVTRQMQVTINTGSGNPYTMVLSPRHKQPIIEKSLWLSDASISRSALSPINCQTDLTHHQLAFPGSDTITNNATGVVADPTGVALPAQANGTFRISLARIRPCEEITAYFDSISSPFGRTGFFRCTNGFIVAWLDNFGPLTVGWKATGEATGTKSGVDWVGRTQVPFYTGRASYMTLRPYDWQTVGVLISDKEVWRGKIGGALPASLGAVYRAGFGVINSSGYVTVGNWTRRTGLTAVSGLQPIGMLLFGDSLMEAWHMALPRQLREALYNSCGMRADITGNYALGGQTSAQQLATLTANGVPAGTTVAVATLGGNDEQTGVAIATLRTTWSSIKAILDAAGVKLHFILTDLPYTTVEAPGHGSDFGNYLNHHLYRTAMMRWAADNGVTVTQSNQGIPPQVPSYLGTDDEVLRDNVHWSPMSMRTIAVQAAYDIAGLFAPSYKKALDPIALPASAYMNSWTDGTSPVRMSINAEGWVRLSGSITKASGVSDQSVLQMFSEFAPQYEIIEPAASLSSGETVRVGVTTAGVVYVNGTQAGDTTIWLDGVTWKMAA